MNTEELLEDAKRFIEGLAMGGDVGFARRNRARVWLEHFERHIQGRVLPVMLAPDAACPACGLSMEAHTVRTPDPRTRIITCPL